MASTKLTPAQLERRRETNNRYAKQYIRGTHVIFNTRFPEQKVLFDWLKSQPNANNYIKNLIFEDMKKKNWSHNND